jgi:hypothetical protein
MITSLENQHLGDVAITLFPNPANEHITINCPKTIQSVQIFDLSGRLISEKMASDNFISLESMAFGRYTMLATTIEGDQYSTTFDKN